MAEFTRTNMSLLELPFRRQPRDSMWTCFRDQFSRQNKLTAAKPEEFISILMCRRQEFQCVYFGMDVSSPGEFISVLIRRRQEFSVTTWDDEE